MEGDFHAGGDRNPVMSIYEGIKVDEIVKIPFFRFPVIPAKAGIQ